jgi:hypothetical protein
MNANRNLAMGVLAAALLGGANVSLTAQDPSCQKWCGCGSTSYFGTRSGCGSANGCAYVACTQPRWGCSDNYNDVCGTPDWCSDAC